MIPIDTINMAINVTLLKFNYVMTTIQLLIP
jgi:hypothetical protein